MDVTLTVPRAYGLVIINVALNWFILMWMALMVGKARKKYDVKYPALYETRDGPSMFNCIQRAHQNSLEWNPAFLAMLLLGGLSSPYMCAGAGLIYNLGRISYAKGYYETNPHRGLWGLYGLFVCLGCTLYTAYRMLAN